MARLAGLASFGVVLAGVLLGLRLVHVVVPMIYPPSDPRPFHTTDPMDATRRAGFAPWVPFYLPQSLGASPRFTVLRRPGPRISITWAGHSTLLLEQEPSTESGLLPPSTAALPGSQGDVYWEGTDMLHAIARRGGVRIEIATDLSLQDLGRVASSLRRTGRGARHDTEAPARVTDPPGE